MMRRRISVTSIRCTAPPVRKRSAVRGTRATAVGTHRSAVGVRCSAGFTGSQPFLANSRTVESPNGQPPFSVATEPRPPEASESSLDRRFRNQHHLSGFRRDHPQAFAGDLLHSFERTELPQLEPQRLVFLHEG